MAVAPMAQPNAEPVEEYEYEQPRQGLSDLAKYLLQFTDPLEYSYEALPPNFSLVQNMLAGAFAGIAVSLSCTPWHAGFPVQKLSQSNMLIGTYCYVPN